MLGTVGNEFTHNYNNYYLALHMNFECTFQSLITSRNNSINSCVLCNSLCQVQEVVFSDLCTLLVSKRGFDCHTLA